MNPAAWPENYQEFGFGDPKKTKQQILSIDILLKYLVETKEMADAFPNEIGHNDVSIDNRKLVMREMPFPPKFKEDLLRAVNYGGKVTIGNISEKIERFFTMEKAACLVQYEDQMWYESDNSTGSPRLNIQPTQDVSDMENFAHRLRCLRAEIYDKLLHKKSLILY